MTEWIEDLPDKYLQCREMGHNWLPSQAWWDKTARTYTRVLRCRHCATKREQSISDRGYVLSSRYIYPDGYRVVGHGPMRADTRAEIRLTSIRRSLEEAN